MNPCFYLLDGFGVLLAQYLVSNSRREHMAGNVPRRSGKIYAEIPMSAKFVDVKLVFIDGSEWPVRKFAIAGAK